MHCDAREFVGFTRVALRTNWRSVTKVQRAKEAVVAATELAGLTGQQKAAIMMLAIGEDRAARLFTSLDEEELKELSQAMVNLGTVNAKTIEALFVEFAQLISGSGPLGSLSGTYASTERLLAKALPGEKVNEIMEDIRGPAGRTMWDKRGNVSESILANFLKNEFPQAVAVVLGKPHSDKAAGILAELPETLASEVVEKMLAMQNVKKEALTAVENTLRDEFMATLSNSRQGDTHEMMAEIFNSSDRNTERRFMSILEERSEESAERVKALMFTFDDLQKLDPSGIQTLLRGVDKAQVGIALKGASETLRDLFFSNMSERQGKILKEDMDAMGAVRLRDVDEAQAGIVAHAKELSDAGELIITDEAGADELVY
ncbi:MAG: flagellar motor switch protein FliG [Alphaproteobacteria bacterium]|nr:flagellar motor switch protein FliG [Alphaproteobacteria bacterium]|tara:strand:+ start:1718 stop:2839 length:1122 start_codon:yes stop_codon:yes gene_type:complete